jgi:hypothetical protein
MNIPALAAQIHEQAEIMRRYHDLGSVRAVARELGLSVYRVQTVVAPEKAAEHTAKTNAKHHDLPSEWAGAVCEICRTREGKMYAAMRCDGDHCGEEATPERLADYERYNAQRRKNNARATREQRRIEPKRSEEAMNSERRAIG